MVFVLDEPGDPCAKPLELEAARAPHARVLYRAGDGPGGWATGKIAAQLDGVAAADPRSEVLVFADADARPEPGWLAALVDPLRHADVGGVTGYRWTMAATRATRWTALRDAWNAVGLDVMAMQRYRFLWGGSMAVRRADFERSDVRARWQRTVSEDVGLTRAMKALGLRIAFAPGALVATCEDWRRAEVEEWVVRQAALTRAAMPRVFRFAAFVYVASLVLLASGAALVLAAPSPLLRVAGACMLLPIASGLPRAWLRERVVRAHMPAARAQDARERALQMLASVAVPAFMLWSLWRARRTERIDWRGRRYELQPTP
jgi:hypothetical protein